MLVGVDGMLVCLPVCVLLQGGLVMGKFGHRERERELHVPAPADM